MDVISAVVEQMPYHDCRRYATWADRMRIERSVFRRSPRAPRPTDDELLAIYARMTAREISDHLCVNYNTVRTWIWQAQKRSWIRRI